MRRCRGAGLAALAALLLVAVARAQVQQQPSLETTEGTGINITCSHPQIQSTDFIYWYRQLPGQGPELLVSIHKDSKVLPDNAGRLSVSADRRSSALWLAGPRRRDAAVYYCALGATARAAGAAAGHEPPRAGPAGGAAAPPAALPGRRSAAPSSAPSPPHRQRTAPHGPQPARNLRSHSPPTQPGLPSLPSPTLPHTELLRAAPLPVPLALRPRLLLLLSAGFAKHRAAP